MCTFLRITIIIAACVALVLATSTLAPSLGGMEKPNALRFTVSIPLLHLREQPDRYARSTGAVMGGSLVSLLQLTDHVETIDGKTGPWLKVRSDSGITGFVFIAWLEVARPETPTTPSYAGVWISKTDPAVRLTLRDDGTYQLRFSLCDLPGYLSGAYRAVPGTVTILFKPGAMEGRAGGELTEAAFDAVDQTSLRARAALGCAPRAGDIFIRR